MNSVVGHVPCVIARHIWFALQKGITISATVIDSKPRKSPYGSGQPGNFNRYDCFLDQC